MALAATGTYTARLDGRTHLQAAPVPQRPCHGAQTGRPGRGRRVTDGVLGAVDEALETHELIKVRVAKEYEGDARASVATELAAGARAQLCQTIGRIVVLYRPRKNEPSIRLPG